MTLLNKKILLMTFLVMAGLFLASCDGLNPNPKYDKYYQGTVGVRTEFEQNSPPYNLYYYEDGDIAENSFDINVKVHNEGSSHTLGAVFVSGYDPALIHVEGVDIPMFTLKDCVFDVGSIIGAGNINFYADCFGVQTRIDRDDWEVKINDLGKLFSEAGFNPLNINKILNETDIVVDGSSGDVEHVNINLDTPHANLDWYNHGKYLVTSFATGVDFSNGQEYALAADDYDYPGGAMDYKTFNAYIQDWPIGLDETYQTFLITSCYLYATYASPTVCIDPEPYTENRKVCYPNGITFSSQGAPVAITAVEQENTKTKAFFTIHVQNVGGGTIYNLGSMIGCNPYNNYRVTEKDIDVVYLMDARIGRDSLECNIPNRRIKLQDGQGIITCSYDYRYAATKSAYETPLVLELWYGYSDTVEKRVRIKRVS